MSRFRRFAVAVMSIEAGSPADLKKPCFFSSNRFTAFVLCGLLITFTCFAQDRRGPFTHAPRSVRSREVDQQHVRLELEFNWEQREFHGRAVLIFSPFKPVRQVTLDAADMTIERVAVRVSKSDAAFKPLKFTTQKNSLTVTLDQTYDGNELLELEVQYKVTKPNYGAHFVVPDDDEPDQPKMVWTQSEPEYARYWYPCIDSPSDRFTSEIIATVPAEYFVLSNGTLKNTFKNPDGTQTWHWSQRKSHVPYLMSVVAGEFEAFEQTWDGIPVVSYVPQGRLPDAARSFEKTTGMMKFFCEKIGYRYPWPKYAQICVDEYNWGGMEHTSATTLNLNTLHDQRAHLDVSSDNLVAHELAHQWFGDLMTCKDWGELWLNESFATYFATLWQEHDKGWNEAAWTRHREAKSYLSEDKRYRRPIVSYRYNRPGNMFDRHSYPKGGRVLHMLRFELGDERFWQAIRRYTEMNQFRTVETADFRRAIEDATGEGMNWFFDQWLYHGGHPEFDVAWQWDAEAKTVRVTVKQLQKVDDMTPLFRSSVEIEVATPDHEKVHRVVVSKAEETFHFASPQRPTRVCFDPNDWVLKTLNFEKSKEELLDQLTGDHHTICRVRAVRALVDFKKHEDVRAKLIGAAQHDDFWAVRQEAVQALGNFKGDAVRAALIRVAAGDAKSLVRREAITALGKFKHDDTRKALRHIIRNDQSYYAIAEALKALVKVDREHCGDDLLAALAQESHREVILKAATNGLVTLKEARAEQRLKKMLSDELTPSERIVLIGALARLKPNDEQSFDLLTGQLDNERLNVRRAAMDALGELATPAALSALRTHRGGEQNFRLVDHLDEVIEKVESKQTDTAKLRKEVESLRKKNLELESRLKKLERAAGK